MISLTCTNCRKVLQMDDGFAGGVCRCQHCGAIQTVPSHLKDRKSVAASSGSKSAKTLYNSPARGEGIPSSGLDELAQIIVSSGLTSSRLRSKEAGHNGEEPRKQSRQQLAFLVAGGAILGMGIALGAWLATSRSGSDDSGSPSPPAVVQGAGGEQTQVANPTFCDLPLDAKVVIYVLDRGSGTGDLFSYLKEATFRSAQSLGGDRKFQIVFWFNGSDDAYPPSQPTFATPQNVDAARRALADVYAHSQSDVASAMKLAVNASPDAIVLATGKGWQLDDAFVNQVMQIRKDKPIKIHTIALGGSETGSALRSIATKTGGECRLVAERDLKRFARE